MARHDHLTGCPCGLYRECKPDCEHNTGGGRATSSALSGTLAIPPGTTLPFQLSTGFSTVGFAENAGLPNPKDLFGVKKPPLHLIPAAAQLYESRVMELGAVKYGPYNWRDHPVKLTVYLSAAMRHLLAKLDGEDADPESGMPHEAHARSCMGIILDALATGNLIDDRPVKGAAPRLIGELTRKD